MPDSLARRRAGVISRCSPALLLALPLLAVLGAVLPAGLLLAGCTDEASHPATLTPDASAPQCSPGTRDCACSDTGGCVAGLLCNSGRCFDPEGTGPEPMDPNVRPAPPPATLPPAASLPDASSDSGPTSNG